MQFTTPQLVALAEAARDFFDKVATTLADGEAPKAEKPKAEKPKTEVKPAEAPKAEKPKAEKPKAEAEAPKPMNKADAAAVFLEVKKVALALVDAHGQDALREIMKTFSIARLSDLSSGDYDRFIDAVKAAT